MSPPPLPHPQRGAALLLAMLTVALVATLSAAAFWQQWRQWTVEQAERQRLDAVWILNGALDWARFMLREDARASQVDHLAEPWALPLQEARLSSFLAANADADADLVEQVFLSGQITDLQSRMNLRNLVEGQATQAVVVPAEWAAFSKLFQALNLPVTELQQFSQALLAVQRASATPGATPTVLLPSRLDDVVWLGISPHTLRTLQPYVTWLPERTPLNLNTASVMCLHASVPGLSLAQAQQWVTRRERQHFTDLESAHTALGRTGTPLSPQRFATSSRFFAVHGHLRIDHWSVDETSLVQRDGLQVTPLWRERSHAPPMPPP